MTSPQLALPHGELLSRISATSHMLLRGISAGISELPSTTSLHTPLSAFCTMVRGEWNRSAQEHDKVLAIKVYCVANAIGVSSEKESPTTQDAIESTAFADLAFRVRVGLSDFDCLISESILDLDVDSWERQLIGPAPPILQLFSSLQCAVDRVSFLLHSTDGLVHAASDPMTLRIAIPLARKKSGDPLSPDTAKIRSSLDLVMNRAKAKDWLSGWVDHSHIALAAGAAARQMPNINRVVSKLLRQQLLGTSIAVLNRHSRRSSPSPLKQIAVTALISPPRLTSTVVAMIYSPSPLSSGTIGFFTGILPHLSHFSELPDPGNRSTLISLESPSNERPENSEDLGDRREAHESRPTSPNSGWSINSGQFSATHNGKSLFLAKRQLTKTTWKILVLLDRHRPNVVSQSRIYHALTGREINERSRSQRNLVEVHVSNLRRMLSSTFGFPQHNWISVQGDGYALIVPVG